MSHPCLYCGRAAGAVAEGETVCHRCLAEYDPTPLQEWARAHGRKLAELEEETGLVKMTIVRAARGQRMSDHVARALAEVTGLDALDFTERARHQEWK